MKIPVKSRDEFEYSDEDNRRIVSELTPRRDRLAKLASDLGRSESAILQHYHRLRRTPEFKLEKETR